MGTKVVVAQPGILEIKCVGNTKSSLPTTRKSKRSKDRSRKIDQIDLLVFDDLVSCVAQAGESAESQISQSHHPAPVR